MVSAYYLCIMQKDSYTTIESAGEGTYKEKGSKFLAFSYPVHSQEEVKALLDVCRKSYHDARHVCYAYRLGVEGEVMRAVDDGEPSGTAGRPILGQIQSFGLTNVLVVVVRYFGGVLLGTGGLAVAYKLAAAEALRSVEIVEKIVESEVCVRFDFLYMNEVMRIVKQLDAQVVEQKYETDCCMKVRVRKNDAARLELSLGKVDTLRFVP